MADQNQGPSSEKDTSARKEIANLTLQIAWNGYSSSMEDKRALDQKANMILVADGVLLGLVINSLNAMELHLGLLSLGLITISGAASLHALWFRTFHYLKALESWNQFKVNNRLDTPHLAMLDTMATLDDAIERNKAQSENIVRSTKIAAAFLLAALVIISLAIFTSYGRGFFN